MGEPLGVEAHTQFQVGTEIGFELQAIPCTVYHHQVAQGVGGLCIYRRIELAPYKGCLETRGEGAVFAQFPFVACQYVEGLLTVVVGIAVHAIIAHCLRVEHTTRKQYIIPMAEGFLQRSLQAIVIALACILQGIGEVAGIAAALV